jgi:hypothetical protein
VLELRDDLWMRVVIRAARLLNARVIGPVLVALARFLDARAEAFRSKGWV